MSSLKSGSYALIADPDPEVNRLLGRLDTVLAGVYPRLCSHGVIDRVEDAQNDPYIVKIAPPLLEDESSLLVPLDSGS